MRILLHADSSRQWESAATITARIARATGAQVTVLTAERVRRKQTEVQRRADHLLGLPKGQLVPLSVGGIVEQVVPRIANEGKFDLLVLGPLGGLDWLTHGHILAYLVAAATPNTLLVRGSTVGFRRALVCTEGGPHGNSNAQAALDLAPIFGLEVHVLHVLSQVAIYDYIKDQPEVDFLDSDHPSAQHLRALRTEVHRAGIQGDAKVRVGPVHEEVLQELREGGHDLLVVGGHAEGPEETFLTRDMAAWLLRHAPVSTLVVRDLWPWPRAQGAA